MYAVIELGGHQHKIEKDMVFMTELTGNDAGGEFTTDKVMLVGGGSDVKIGSPYVQGAQVTLKVLADERAPKINGFVYKKRKGYQKKWGHRQKLQRLQVLDIKA